MLKVYGIKMFIKMTPPPPIKEYVLNTRFEIDNYGWPLNLNEKLINRNYTQTENMYFCKAKYACFMILPKNINCRILKPVTRVETLMQ